MLQFKFTFKYIIVCTVGIITLSTPCYARVYDIYRADYIKGPFCSAIGGACASDPDFDNSFFQNPASLEAGKENWDYDYDFNKSNSPEPGMGKDNIVSESTFYAGGLYAGPKWGYGLALSVQNDQVQSTAVLVDQNGFQQAINVNDRGNTYILTLPVAYKYNSKLSLGAAASFLYQNHSIDVAGASASIKPASDWPALSLSIGGIYSHSDNWRYGLWIKSPQVYEYNLNMNVNSLGNQITYKEDFFLQTPWMINLGASFMPLEDERTIFMDLDIIGSTPDGYLQSFDSFTANNNAAAQKVLVNKGRNIVIEPRLGWRSAWGRGSGGTYMLGAYYENSRWENEEGRAHETFGIAYKWTVNFYIFDTIELMFGLDIANNFQQAFVTYR